MAVIIRRSKSCVAGCEYDKQPARAAAGLFNATRVSRMLNVAFAALLRYSDIAGED